MKTIVVESAQRAAQLITAVEAENLVVDLDFTLTEYDSTSAAAFWIYDVCNPARRPWRRSRPRYLMFRQLLSKLHGRDPLREHIGQLVQQLSADDLAEFGKFLNSLPVSQVLFEAVNQTAMIRPVCVLSGTPQSVLTTVTKGRLASSVSQVGSYANGRKETSGVKHRHCPFPPSKSCIVTDNAEDLNGSHWRSAIFICPGNK